MLLEKPRDTLAQAMRQDVAFAGHYAAKTSLILPQTLEIKRCIGGDPRNPRRIFLPYCFQLGSVALFVCVDERGPKIFLRRKVMMNARLAYTDGFGEIRIAETGIAACSDQNSASASKRLRVSVPIFCPLSTCPSVKAPRPALRLAIDGQELTY